MFTHAIVKTPAPTMIKGITHAGLGEPNYELALNQHKNYINALGACGLLVTELPADAAYPDSCFIEDPAIITPHCAIITNPGAASRNGETTTIKQALSEKFQHIHEINSPGTLDGGDVMMVGSHFYIGLSARTNQAGAEQLIEFLKLHELTGSMIEMAEVLHLKTGVSYLEQNHLLVSGEFVHKPEFSSFDKIEIAATESYAANCIWINGTVILPAGFPQTLAQLKSAGFKVLTVNVSEFEKLDGGLSCLSLRY